VAGVKDVTEEADGDYTTFQLKLEANAEPSDEVLRLASERRWSVRELVRRRATLEDVFVELTHADS
jgi:ABC-2 type transport system ATP-binding protein